MRVLVAGATGLVGGACVRQLLARGEVDEVVAVVRRPWAAAPSHPRLRVAVHDFAALATATRALAPEAIICALGTTMRQAGSPAAFRVVDHEYPVALARGGREGGAKHFLLVSALGATPESRVFYNRVKGETERDIGALGYPSFTIARPSLLLGPREEFRPLEFAMGLVGWAMPGRWRPVHVEQVAAALVQALRAPSPGTTILENPALRRAVPAH